MDLYDNDYFNAYDPGQELDAQEQDFQDTLYFELQRNTHRCYLISHLPGFDQLCEWTPTLPQWDGEDCQCFLESLAAFTAAYHSLPDCCYRALAESYQHTVSAAEDALLDFYDPAPPAYDPAQYWDAPADCKPDSYDDQDSYSQYDSYSYDHADLTPDNMHPQPVMQALRTIQQGVCDLQAALTYPSNSDTAAEWYVDEQEEAEREAAWAILCNWDENKGPAAALSTPSPPLEVEDTAVESAVSEEHGPSMEPRAVLQTTPSPLKVKLDTPTPLTYLGQPLPGAFPAHTLSLQPYVLELPPPLPTFIGLLALSPLQSSMDDASSIPDIIADDLPEPSDTPPPCKFLLGL